MPQNFNNLDVYNEAYSLAQDIYKETEKIEKHFRLKEQLFGSSTAVCANLAEMAAMDNKKQQAQKVKVCIGETNESEFWLNFCKDAGLIEESKFKDYINRLKVIRMKLYNLLRSIEKESEKN